MKKKFMNTTFGNYFIALSGTLLFAVATRMFAVPVSLYNGGFTGLAQIIELLLGDIAGIDFIKQIDATGIFFYLINIPLFVLAFKELGRSFFIKTLICVTVQSIFLVIVPIPQTPIVSDLLTSSIIAGLIAGYGIGITLQAGGSGGGQDILGVYCAKKYPDFSVGKVAILINVVIYGVCIFFYNVEIVIYSIIYAVIVGLVVDRVHLQNIKTSVMIFTKNNTISAMINKELDRGATEWKGLGSYTNESTNIILTVVSKYELQQLRTLVRQLDPKAFLIVSENLRVDGNFEKRF